MIAYIQGALLKKEADRILLLANGIGYEVWIPPMLIRRLEKKAIGDPLSLHIYFHQTERQPKPVLIGFDREAEKEFFQYLITVEDIGPLKALKALTLPVSQIADAIESQDLKQLKQLKGIGPRTAQKIVATLRGKVCRFGSGAQQQPISKAPRQAFASQVIEVLVSQLGHRLAEAREMVDKALSRNPAISSPEELFDEIYRGKSP